MYTHPDEIDDKKSLYLAGDVLENNKEKIVEEKKSELLEICNDNKDKNTEKTNK